MGREEWVSKVCSQVCVCVFASMSAGRRAGKSCAECVSLDASWQGVSPPAVVCDVCV